MDLGITWLLRFGIVGLVFGLGHFKVVGSWPCSSLLFTLDLGHFSVVELWVHAQRCQRHKETQFFLTVLLMLLMPCLTMFVRYFSVLQWHHLNGTSDAVWVVSCWLVSYWLVSWRGAARHGIHVEAFWAVRWPLTWTWAFQCR